MQTLSGVRKSSAKLGDDTTFTRWVLTGPKHGKQHSPRLPGLELGFIREGRTKFPTRVLPPSDNVLVSGHSNIKIGRDVRQGKLKGYWIYTLSLEERATCPSSCSHWQSCYGNNMPFAKRVSHRDPRALEEAIERNLERLLAVRGRPGILVRLHALGDFYDESYVDFWNNMLAKHDRLAIFGYTAWPPDSQIGSEVYRLIDLYPGRAMMRFSNGGLSDRSTVPIVDEVDCPPGAFVCPEQTGQFEACGKCGACWSTLKNLALIAH